MWKEISLKEGFLECSVKRGLFLVQSTQFISCAQAQCGGEPAAWPQKMCSVCTHIKKRPLLTLLSQAFTLKRDLINRVSFDYTQNQVMTLKATLSILLLITLTYCAHNHDVMTNCYPGALFRDGFPFLVLFSGTHFWFPSLFQKCISLQCDDESAARLPRLVFLVRVFFKNVFSFCAHTTGLFWVMYFSFARMTGLFSEVFPSFVHNW